MVLPILLTTRCVILHTYGIVVVINKSKSLAHNQAAYSTLVDVYTHDIVDTSKIG